MASSITPNFVARMAEKIMPTAEDIMANEGCHEPIEELSDKTRDMHRAILSLMEELEAVDWHNQRVDACEDAESTRRW